MDIIHQYYNEIVLAFNNYDTDFEDGIIVIYIPDDSKALDPAFEKISALIAKIAESLEPRDKVITIRVKKNTQSRDIILDINEETEQA